MKTTSGVIGLELGAGTVDSSIGVYIQRINYKNPLPEYKTILSSGMDVYANLEDGVEVIIGPGDRAIVGAGIKVAIPEGWGIDVRPRSGLAIKQGVTVLNTPGTIDADYLDELGIIIINHDRKPFKIKNGDRIAQILLQAVPKIKWVEVEDLKDISNVNRGGGFGSTGV